MGSEESTERRTFTGCQIVMKHECSFMICADDYPSFYLNKHSSLYGDVIKYCNINNTLDIEVSIDPSGRIVDIISVKLSKQ